MRCPVCKESLKNTLRKGVEIDFCPKCRGVWLDRGELEKIIERSSKPYTPGEEGSAQKAHEAGKFTIQRYPERGKGYESFVAEVFDFDD